jgi:hypothetical protein
MSSCANRLAHGTCNYCSLSVGYLCILKCSSFSIICNYILMYINMNHFIRLYGTVIHSFIQFSLICNVSNCMIVQ